jgi:hypothetical protein
MIYREYLVMRKALAWFAGLVLILQFVGVLFPPKGVVKADLGNMILTSGIFAAVFAWIFGVALGNGSRQPARVLWVLPEERWKLAVQVISVDFAAITLAAAWFFASGFLQFPFIHAKVEFVGPVRAADILLALAGAFATYGWGALVGMIGRRMPYAGIIATPALVLWLNVAEQGFAISPIFRAPILANPFAVVNTSIALTAAQRHHYAIDVVTRSLQWLGTAWEPAVLLAIVAATCGLAVVLWQRAEVIY